MLVRRGVFWLNVGWPTTKSRNAPFVKFASLPMGNQRWAYNAAMATS